MKKLVILLVVFASIILLFSSCQKELSLESKRKCGIVREISFFMSQIHLIVQYPDTTMQEDIGVFEFSNIQVGDKFCK